MLGTEYEWPPATSNLMCLRGYLWVSAGAEPSCHLLAFPSSGRWKALKNQSRVEFFGSNQQIQTWQGRRDEIVVATKIDNALACNLVSRIDSFLVRFPRGSSNTPPGTQIQTCTVNQNQGCRKLSEITYFPCYYSHWPVDIFNGKLLKHI